MDLHRSWPGDRDRRQPPGLPHRGGLRRAEPHHRGARAPGSDPEGTVLDREYDDRNRLEAEIRDGDRTEYTYDLNDNLTEIDCPETEPWVRAYDGADRLASVTDPDGGITEFDYDENGNLKTQTDAEGQATDFKYDDLDRLEKKILPDGRGGRAARKSSDDVGKLGDDLGKQLQMV